MILETIQLNAENFNKKAIENGLKLISHYNGFLSWKISRGNAGKTIIESWWTDEDSLQEFRKSGTWAKWQYMLQSMAASPLVYEIAKLDSFGLNSCGG